MAEKDEVKEVRIKPNLENYVNGVSGSGKRTKRADDAVAAALDGFTVQETADEAARMCDIPAKDLLDKYSHLNVGMQRMNLGNRIRGAVAKLDKAHEADKAVVPGLRTLGIEAAKGQDAVKRRRTAKAKADEEKSAKAAAKAKEAAKAEKGKDKKAA